MGGSHIANLTLDPSFGHNLCVKCPNGSCKPILDIYVLRSFYWCKNCLNSMGFDPYSCFMKNWEFIGSPSGVQFPKWEPTWECGGSFLHIFPHSRASFLAHTLSSFCLGHEPKVKVTTCANTPHIVLPKLVEKINICFAFVKWCYCVIISLICGCPRVHMICLPWS
jgi:hypothetical protein